MTFCCIITPNSGITDRYFIMEFFENIGEK